MANAMVSRSLQFFLHLSVFIREIRGRIFCIAVVSSEKCPYFSSIARGQRNRHSLEQIIELLFG